MGLRRMEVGARCEVGLSRAMNASLVYRNRISAEGWGYSVED